jgi:WD40 repeat protein
MNLFALAFAFGPASVAPAQEPKKLAVLNTDFFQRVCLAFSPDGKRLALSGLPRRGLQGPVTIWNVEQATVEQTLSVPLLRGNSATSIDWLAYSPDGKLLVAQHGLHPLLWDLPAKKEPVHLYDLETGLLAFSPDGKILVGDKGIFAGIDLIDMKERKRLATLKPGRTQGGAVAFSRNAALLAVAENAGLRVWKVDTRAEVRTLKTGRSACLALVFDPDGKTLTGVLKGPLRVRRWDMTTGEVTGDFPLKAKSHEKSWCVALSVDGKLVASGEDHLDQKGEVKLWDATTGKELATFPKAGVPISALAFSPNGGVLAVADSDDQQVKVSLWDVSRNK